MDMFVWKEVVMTNQFSEGGVLQLVKDTKDGLFPIFGVYTTRPATVSYTHLTLPTNREV